MENVKREKVRTYGVGHAEGEFEGKSEEEIRGRKSRGRI